MADELPSKKTILIGDRPVEVIEPEVVPAVFADIWTEARIYNGVVYLSLASVVLDGNTPIEARICARLRMSIETAANVQTAISNALTAAQEAHKQAN